MVDIGTPVGAGGLNRMSRRLHHPTGHLRRLQGQITIRRLPRIAIALLSVDGVSGRCLLPHSGVFGCAVDNHCGSWGFCLCYRRRHPRPQRRTV